jgi:prepilin-type N-terminal cleavage/methylation domain-containing protein
MIHARSPRNAFTLVELMVAMAVATLLAATVLVAMWGAQEEARAVNTQSQISQLHDLIMNQWQTYSTRSVAMPAGTNPRAARQLRLVLIRDLMRMELPDRITDVRTPPIGFIDPNTNQPVLPPNDLIDPLAFNPAAFPYTPHLWRTYLLRAGSLMRISNKPWTESFEQAECLYLIVSALQEQVDSPMRLLSQSRLVNVDGDAIPEIGDAWGNPVCFLRWAPGFSEYPGLDQQWGTADDSSRASPSFFHSRISPTVSDPSDSPDPLDPLRMDPRWDSTYLLNVPTEVVPFQLVPLIYAKKPELDDILFDVARTSGTTFRADDYGIIAGNSQAPPFRYRDPVVYQAYFINGVLATPWHKAMDPYKYTDNGTGPLIGSFNPAYGEQAYDFLYTNHTPETR